MSPPTTRRCRLSARLLLRPKMAIDPNPLKEVLKEVTEIAGFLRPALTFVGMSEAGSSDNAAGESDNAAGELRASHVM